MNIQELKNEISDKELRLSQLRSMDMNKLTPDIRKLITSLEKEIADLKQRLGEEQ